MRKIVRKALCGFLACGLLAGLLPVAAGAASTPFYDVAGEAWYATAVNYVYSNKLMSGLEDQTFGPDIEATRGQIVTILYRLDGQPTVVGKAPFTDVAAGSYYNSSIGWANAMDIVSGTGNGLFEPGSAITREQMATILYRFATYKKFDVSAGANLDVYDDVWQVSSYAKTAMSWAVGSGLMNGTDASNVSPHTLTSRAVLATTLMRFCSQYGLKVPEVNSTATVVVTASASTAVAEQPAPAAEKPVQTTAPAVTAPAVSVPVSSGTVSCVTVDGTTVQTPKFTFQWPVQGTLSSGYGYRYIFGSTSFHRGIDISAPQGTAIHAGQAGTVIFSGDQGSYGNLVIVDHGNGFQSYYAHNTKLLVNKGDVVQKNQVIAACGMTGRATGNHCHFEVHYKGQVVDPMNYLPAKNDAPANTVVSGIELEPEA